MMQTEDLLVYLQTFYRGTMLPLRLFVRGECVLGLPSLGDAAAVINSRLRRFEEQPQDVSVVQTSEFISYGIVKDDTRQVLLVAGPVSTLPLSLHDVAHILHEAGVPGSGKEPLQELFRLTPLFPPAQFSALLSLLAERILGRMPKGLLLSPPDTADASSIERGLRSSMVEQADVSSYETTWQFEQQMMHLVEQGNPKALEKLLLDHPHVEAGKVAENTLRQEKNIFITTTTELTRHAIAGGLAPKTAFTLSDTYLQSMERMNSGRDVQTLLFMATLDFARRVEAQKIPPDISENIYKSIRYIRDHVTDALSVEDVARAVGLSRAYLSRRFMREMGFGIGAFITRTRLEESRSLLSYTDQSIAEISAHLGFSSQANYQTAFRRQYGMTPAQFRKNTVQKGTN